jgi:hypothetical protein
MLNKRLDASSSLRMPNGAGQVALLGPTTIAIHDDGDVLGQCCWREYGHELKIKHNGHATALLLKSKAIDYLLKMTNLQPCA